jgi:hypothetical protein
MLFSFLFDILRFGEVRTQLTALYCSTIFWRFSLFTLFRSWRRRLDAISGRARRKANLIKHSTFVFSRFLSIRSDRFSVTPFMDDSQYANLSLLTIHLRVEKTQATLCIKTQMKWYITDIAKNVSRKFLNPQNNLFDWPLLFTDNVAWLFLNLRGWTFHYKFHIIIFKNVSPFTFQQNIESNIHYFIVKYCFSSWNFPTFYFFSNTKEMIIS